MPDTESETDQELPVLATDVYRRFIDALNAQDLDAAAACVDLARYEENCVGFTPGFVRWPEASTSLVQVWAGIPDLRVEVVDLHGDDTTALARGRAGGNNTGRLYGVPATKRPYSVTFFDSVQVVDGLIVRRVQQADVVTQMRQLYGRAIGAVGLFSCLTRVDPAAPVL